MSAGTVGSHHGRGFRSTSSNTAKLGGLAVDFGDRTKMTAVCAGSAGQIRGSFKSGRASGAILEPFIFRLEETCFGCSFSEEDLRAPVDRMRPRCCGLTGLSARLWGSQAASRDGPTAESGG